MSAAPLAPGPRPSLERASAAGAAGTTLSRLLGLGRDTAIGHVFGAGQSADAFWMAFTIPNVLRRLLADEGLTGVLIPAVDRAESEAGRAEARRLAGAGLAATLLSGAAVVVLGIALAPWLVRAFAYGYASDPAKLALTVSLTRWLLPFLLFVTLYTYCEGLVNRHGQFFVPKAAPGVVSACVAAAALFLAGRLAEPVFALVVGALVGGLLHLLLCLPTLARVWGLTWPLFGEMRGPRFAAFLRQMGLMAGIGVLAQANIMVLRQLAALLPEGAVTHYWYASRLVDFAQGVVAVAVASALLPRIAADAATRSWPRFRGHFGEAARLSSLVLVPGAGLLVAMAEPIVAVLFQHGAFDRGAAVQTAATLRMMVPFMLAIAGINLVKRAFYALEDRRTLLWVGLTGTLLTGALGYLLTRRLGVRGLGLGLSVSSVVELSALLLLLRWRMGAPLGLPVSAMVKSLLASLPAAASAQLVCLLGRWSAGAASPRNWLVLGLAALTGTGLYVGLARWLGLRARVDPGARSAHLP